MVDCVGHYYGALFKGYQVVTQWYLLSPTTFNKLVSTGIYHSVALVAREEAIPEDFRRAVQCLVALFYKDNGIISYPQPYHLQVEMDVLTGILDQVGVRINVTKVVCMVCQPFQMVAGNSEDKYKQQMTR